MQLSTSGIISEQSPGTIGSDPTGPSEKSSVGAKNDKSDDATDEFRRASENRMSLRLFEYAIAPLRFGIYPIGEYRTEMVELEIEPQVIPS